MTLTENLLERAKSEVVIAHHLLSDAELEWGYDTKEFDKYTYGVKYGIRNVEKLLEPNNNLVHLFDLVEMLERSNLTLAGRIYLCHM